MMHSDDEVINYINDIGNIRNFLHFVHDLNQRAESGTDANMRSEIRHLVKNEFEFVQFLQEHYKSLRANFSGDNLPTEVAFRIENDAKIPYKLTPLVQNKTAWNYIIAHLYRYRLDTDLFSVRISPFGGLTLHCNECKNNFDNYVVENNFIDENRTCTKCNTVFAEQDILEITQKPAMQRICAELQSGEISTDDIIPSILSLEKTQQIYTMKLRATTPDIITENIVFSTRNLFVEKIHARKYENLIRADFPTAGTTDFLRTNLTFEEFCDNRYCVAEIHQMIAKHVPKITSEEFLLGKFLHELLVMRAMRESYSNNSPRGSRALLRANLFYYPQLREYIHIVPENVIYFYELMMRGDVDLRENWKFAVNTIDPRNIFSKLPYPDNAITYYTPLSPHLIHLFWRECYKTYRAVVYEEQTRKNQLRYYVNIDTATAAEYVTRYTCKTMLVVPVLYEFNETHVNASIYKYQNYDEILKKHVKGRLICNINGILSKLKQAENGNWYKILKFNIGTANKLQKRVPREQVIVNLRQI